MSNPSLVAVVDIETLAQGHDAVIGAIGVVIVDEIGRASCRERV